MAFLKLDDRDPSIVYSSGWHHGGVKAEFDKTTTWNDKPGTTAKLSFEGTGVQVFGTISPKKSGSIAPISSYSIDDGATVEFRAIQTSDTLYSQLFFQSPILPPGRHTLTITNKLDSDPTFLDFFVVAPNPNSNTPVPFPTQSSAVSSTTTSSSVTSFSSSSSTSSSQVTLLPGVSSPTAPSIPSPSQVIVPGLSTQPTPATAPAGADGTPSSSPGGVPAVSNSSTGATKNSAAGAIAGGVVAVIVALALMALAVVYWRRNQRRRKRFGGFRSADSFWRPMASEMGTTTAMISAPTRAPVVNTTRTAFPPADHAAPRTENPIYTTTAHSTDDAEANVNVARASAHTFASSFYVDDRAPQTEGYPSRSYLPPSQAMNQNHPPYLYYAQ